MTETPSDPETSETGPALDWSESQDLEEKVKGLFQVLGKALRAHQLYDENNPVFQRFVSQLREALQNLWGEMDRLPVTVEEKRLLWIGKPVYESDSRTDSLSFLFYKDGIREFTLHEGLELHELNQFLQILNRARDLRAEGDDLLTILWDAELKYFTYGYIDILAESMSLEPPSAGDGGFGGFHEILQAELGEDALTEGDRAGESSGGGRNATGVVSAGDFNPTIYSLDPAELDQLQEEIRREMERDVRGEVLSALFDRIEEARFPERQREILEIFEMLLPNFLSRGLLSYAGAILEELARLLASDDALRPGERMAAERLLDEVSGADTLKELIQSLEDGSVSPEPAELAALLRHLRADSLRPLLRAAEEAGDPNVRTIIQNSVRGIAKRYTRALVDCLEADDPVVVVGALNLAGSLQLRESAARVAELLAHEAPEVRLAAIHAATALKMPVAIGALLDALSDPEREIRIAAAKALGGLRYGPAAGYFRDAIKGKQLRHSDLSEQIAFFESYGLLRDPEGVRLLDGLLNGRGFLGRKESGEIRACAALALGKMRSGEAIAALEKAANEQDPVVRSAVNRALREEG